MILVASLLYITGAFTGHRAEWIQARELRKINTAWEAGENRTSIDSTAFVHADKLKLWSWSSIFAGTVLLIVHMIT